MSGGLNRRFMANPRGFLEDNVIHTTAMERLARRAIPELNPDIGIAHFDLRRDSAGKIQMLSFPYRGKRPGVFSHSIRAYWLPWDDGGGAAAVAACQTVRLDLGNEADFFFTSQLSGCRMQIAAGPTVLHIPGNMTEGMTGSGWREQQAQNELGAEYPNSHRWSATQDYSAHTTVNFIGVRDQHGWNFYSQTVQGDIHLPRVALAFHA